MMSAEAQAIDRPLAGRTVLVRVSLDSGIDAGAAELVRRLAADGARVAVIAGRGQPLGDINPALSLAVHAAELETATGLVIHFIPESTGSGAEAALHALPEGAVALMENLRFHADERRRGKVFAMRLGVLGDHFIDAGDPPVRPDSWQSALADLLPPPPGYSSTQSVQQEA